MAIEKFDYDKCIRCGMCRDVCSCDVIAIDEEKKPYIRYKEECCLCLYCMKDCPAGAITITPDKYVKQLQAWG